MGERPEPADGNRLMDYSIAPLSEHTGAEVRGIDLTEPVDGAVQARLNRAFIEQSVLVFRDQHLEAVPAGRRSGLVWRGLSAT
jgi:taurine dioxygenase